MSFHLHTPDSCLSVVLGAFAGLCLAPAVEYMAWEFVSGHMGRIPVPGLEQAVEEEHCDLSPCNVDFGLCPVKQVYSFC